MMTRAGLLRAARARLADAGAQEAEADARLLFCAATGLQLVDVIASPDIPVSDEGARRLDVMLDRRMTGEPVGRILGRKDFWGMSFALSPGTLEPRADSEVVVEAALDHLGPRRQAPLRIADLGTGTGCLLAALLAECPNACGVAVDLSPDAAATARANLAANGFKDRAEVIIGSWTAAPGPFDLVISNPPYIPAADIAALAREVRAHDPMLALDGGADGLDAYREIASLIPGILAADGVVIVEIGFDQADQASRIAEAAGLRRIACRRDLQGHDRALVFTRA